MPESIQLLILYFANLVLDYPLQCEFQKKYKQEYHYVMWVHCCIWGIGLSLVLFWLGIFAWWKVIFLVGGHFIMDTWKARGWYKKIPLRDGGAFAIDQACHIVQLLLVCFL
jgi:uncharacterized membrane protein YozB (DUF420 family)